MLTLGDVCYTDGDARYDVTDQLLGPVLPQPAKNRKVHKEKVQPSLAGGGREERATDRLRHNIKAEVLGLKWIHR